MQQQLRYTTRDRALSDERFYAYKAVLGIRAYTRITFAIQKTIHAYTSLFPSICKIVVVSREQFFLIIKSRQMITLHLVLSGRAIQTRGQLVKKIQHTGTALAGLTLPTRKMLLHASLDGPHVVGGRKYVSWEGIQFLRGATKK
jgi:hypothetical protein